MKTISTTQGLVIERGALANGPYFFMVREGGTVVGAGKLMVQD